MEKVDGFLLDNGEFYKHEPLARKREWFLALKNRAETSIQITKANFEPFNDFIVDNVDEVHLYCKAIMDVREFRAMKEATEDEQIIE